MNKWGLHCVPVPIAEREDVPNPLRGWHISDDRWFPVPIYNLYRRYDWAAVETGPGSYDFAAIDRLLEEAAKLGVKSGIRFRSVSRPGVGVPAYLTERLAKGWWLDRDGDGHAESYIPDWNDPYYLERAKELLMEVGRRYDGDPRLAWVDIGMYGTWGEWHITPYGENLVTGARKATPETKRALVDMHIEAFKNTRLVMMSGDSYALEYAAWRSREIGFRRDNIGDPHFEKANRKVRDQVWRHAPVIVEPINLHRIRRELLEEQVVSGRVATLNMINLGPWDKHSEDQKQQVMEAGKRSGFRIALKELYTELEATAGEIVTIRSLWMNTGITPCYEAWNVTFRLHDIATGDVVWQGVSGLHLMELLPTSVPFEVNDTFWLPHCLQEGTYSLTVIVEEPRRYGKPLALAIQGRDEDGGYRLATLQVKSNRNSDFTFPEGHIQSPAPLIGSLPKQVGAGDMIVLSGCRSYDAYGYLTDYMWEMTNEAGQLVKRKFGAEQKTAIVQPGAYSVSLTVRNDRGDERTAVTRLLVTAPLTEPPIPPAPMREPRTAPPVKAAVRKSIAIENWASGVNSWQLIDDTGTSAIAEGGLLPLWQGEGASESCGSVRLNFTGKALYQYAVKNGLDGYEWAREGHNALRFWIRGDKINSEELSPESFQLQLREFNDEGERWNYPLGSFLREDGWMEVTVPLHEDVWRHGGGVLYRDEKLTLHEIEQIRFYAPKGTAGFEVQLGPLMLVTLPVVEGG